MEIKVVINESAILDRCVEEILGKPEWSNDDEGEPMVDAACEAGFVEFDHYGQPKGPRVPFATFIHKAISQMFANGGGGYSEPWGPRVAREAFTKHIAAAMESEAAHLRKVVRAAVDERLSGDVSKILRAALGLT